MVKLHPQFVIDSNQQPKAVMLPVQEWEQIMDELEELDDIRAYDEAKADTSEAVDFEQALRDIEQG